MEDLGVRWSQAPIFLYVAAISPDLLALNWPIAPHVRQQEVSISDTGGGRRGYIRKCAAGQRTSHLLTFDRDTSREYGALKCATTHLWYRLHPVKQLQSQEGGN